MAGRLQSLAVFDLDHTLIQGDTDSLWCDYLLDLGWLPDDFRAANLRLEQQYQAGSIAPQAFTEFYAKTLAALSPEQALELRASFTRTVILPRIKPGARGLLASHQRQGDICVLSSATSAFLCALTAEHLGLVHVIGTELAVDAQGRFTGQTCGTLNMRAGKVLRLRAWLAEQQLEDSPLRWAGSTFYSDSINDLPLLQAVGRPVAIDPDDQLLAHAQLHGWPTLSLN